MLGFRHSLGGFMENITLVERSQGAKAEGKIPAVIYGKSVKSRSVFVNVKQQFAQKWHSGAKFVLTLDGQRLMGTLEEIQKNPVGSQIRHLSFHVVGRDEVVKVDVPVVLRGKARGEKTGGITTVMYPTVSVKGRIADLPEEISLDVDGLGLNEQITLSGISLPENVKFAYDRDTHFDDIAVVVCRPSNFSRSESGEATGETAETSSENTEEKTLQ